MLLPDSFNYLLKFLKKKMPFYYSEDILSQFEEKLYTYFTNNGFVFFNYERIEEKNADTLKILYNLKPGKKIKIKEIKVLGLSQKTRKKIALDAIELKEGEYISFDKIYISIKNLYSLGIIRSVSYEILPNSDSTEAVISFNLREEKMRALRTGYGYSSDGFSQAKFELEHLNIFNNAQKLALLTRFQFNSKIFLHEEISIRYQDPNFFIRKNILELLPFYYIDRIEDVRRFGFQSRYIIKRNFWVFENSFIWQNIKSIEKGEDLFYLNGMGFSYSQDLRDNILNTKSGYHFHSYINTYGSIFGGTENIIKMGYSYSFFETVKTYTFAFKISGGHVIPYIPTEIVPYSERFLLGGEGSLRGVKRYSVGDFDIRGIRSGTNFYLFNFEARKFLTDYLQFVLFFDTGSNSNIFSYKFFKNNAFGFGIGVRYYFGILPFRVDLATNNHFIKTREVFFYLGLGHSF